MTHYTKGTPSPLKRAPTACRRPVSGTVSLPSSGCFSPFPHGTGSLSVSKEYLAFEGGPPIFRQDFTCPALLNTSDQTSHTGLSPALADLPRSFWSFSRLGWSPFARHYWGSLILMSFPPGTEMFQFPGFASCDLWIQSQDTWLAPSLIAVRTTTKLQVGCPIRRSLDQSPFPAPQCLSQGITSFIASCCQGIHQTPFSRLIRSRDGQVSSGAPFVRRHSPSSRKPQARALQSEVIHFPAPCPGKDMEHSVSVLDLEQNRSRKRLAAPPGHAHTRANQTVLMFLSLHNVTHRPDRTRQRATRAL